MMRRKPLRSSQYLPFYPPMGQEREDARAERMGAMAKSVAAAPRSQASYGGATAGPVPKSPADRLQAFKDLAQGEDCTVKRYGSWCRCDPATTVLAHTNTQADQKGLGYKAHDTAGFFAGHECHSYIDQPPPGVSRDELDALVALAQARTHVRLVEIAGSKTMRPRKIATARLVLAMKEKRDGVADAD